MAQLNCSWHIAYWHVKAAEFFIICRRYPDSLTLFAKVDGDDIEMVSSAGLEMSSLAEWASCPQGSVRPLVRARLRALLDALPCNGCRCAFHTAQRYSEYLKVRAEQCSLLQDAE